MLHSNTHNATKSVELHGTWVRVHRFRIVLRVLKAKQSRCPEFEPQAVLMKPCQLANLGCAVSTPALAGKVKGRSPKLVPIGRYSSVQT